MSTMDSTNKYSYGKSKWKIDQSEKCGHETLLWTLQRRLRTIFSNKMLRVWPFLLTSQKWWLGSLLVPHALVVWMLSWWLLLLLFLAAKYTELSILRTARFQFRLTFAVYGPVASDHSSFTWWTLYCFFERGPFDRKRYTGCTGFGLRQKVLLRFDLIFRGGFPLYLQLVKKKTRYSVSCFFLFSILTNTLRFSAKTKNLQ